MGGGGGGGGEKEKEGRTEGEDIPESKVWCCRWRM